MIYGEGVRSDKIFENLSRVRVNVVRVKGKGGRPLVLKLLSTYTIYISQIP